MRHAVLSDIHGNAWALDAVFAELARAGVHGVINLGDCFYGPLDPGGTLERLRALDWPTVRGNQDRVLLSPPTSATAEFTSAQIGAEGSMWVRDRTSACVQQGEILACHGDPRHDDVTLIERVEPGHGRMVMNPGSVGLPAYEDDLPLRHVMEAGTPHARWAILTRMAAGYGIEFRATPYDAGPAVRSALANGREDWAHWLKSGRARLAG
jgi:predicted phosphodiesterase